MKKRLFLKNKKVIKKALYLGHLVILSNAVWANSYETETVAGVPVHIQKNNTVTTTTSQGRVNVGKAGNSNVFVHGTTHSTNMNTTTNPPERTKNTHSSTSVGIGIDF